MNPVTELLAITLKWACTNVVSRKLYVFNVCYLATTVFQTHYDYYAQAVLY